MSIDEAFALIDGLAAKDRADKETLSAAANIALKMPKTIPAGKSIKEVMKNGGS